MSLDLILRLEESVATYKTIHMADLPEEKKRQVLLQCALNINNIGRALYRKNKYESIVFDCFGEKDTIEKTPIR